MTHLISVFGLQNGGELYSRAAHIVGFQIESDRLNYYRKLTVEQAATDLAIARVCYTHGYHQVAPSVVPWPLPSAKPYTVTFRSTVQPSARCRLAINGKHVAETVRLFELSGIWRMESVK